MNIFPNKFVRNSVFVLTTTVAAAGCMGGGGGGGGGTAATATPGGTTAPQTATVSGGTGPTITWEEPSRNADGSVLRDLIGYRLSYGLSPNDYTESRTLNLSDVDCMFEDDASARTCSYQLSGLSSASWYVSVQTVDMDGNLSSPSEPAIVTVQ